MQQVSTTNPLYFLPADSEMAALIRQKDWSQSPVGPPESWPPSLRTTLGTLLTCPFPMFLWWGPALIQFYNDAYRPSLGHPGKHPAALGQPGADCWPDIWPVIQPLIDSVRYEGQSIRQENRLIPIYRNGRLEDVYWTFGYSPVRDESGQVAGVLAVCQETTRQVTEANEQQRIVQTAARWKHVFGQVPVGICILQGPTFIIDLINDEQLKIVGRPGQNLLGQPVFEAIPEAAGQGLEQLLTEVLTTGEPIYANEIGIQLPRDGRLQTCYFNLVYQALRDETDRIVGVVTVASEVTDQVLARQEVQESQLRLRSIIANAPAGMGLLVGRDLVFELPNRALIDIVGKGPDIAGKPLHMVMPELTTENQPFLKILDDVYTSGVLFQTFGSLVKILRDGVMTDSYYNITYTPLRDTAGEVFAILDIAIDVTEQIKAQRQLEDSESQYRQLAEVLEERVKKRTDDLERSNLDLIQFASVASHDLKEPSRKIQTFATLLKELLADRINDEEADLFRRLVNSAARMQTLVSDVLRLSKLSDTTATFGLVDLNAVLNLIRDDLELTIREQEAEFQTGILPTVQAEPAQMHQLFLNLASNALKFQNVRTPRIRVEPVPLTESVMSELGLPDPHQYVVIAVSDNGIGFDLKYKDKIFGMFQRLHGRSQFAGTGIGLTIVKKIVDNHRGYIDVQSQPGVGTTFRVALPLTPASELQTNGVDYR